MPDYSKSIIYTIRSRDNVYVGSTIDFRSRKNQHKGCIYNENSAKYNGKIYKTIRGNNHEWDMQPYSQYPCNSKMELTIEEERVRQHLKADLNSQSCGTGLIGKEDYQKQYRAQHKDKAKQYRDEYYKGNKDKLNEYQKQYNDQHKDELKQYHEQYREEHKDKIREQKKQKITCVCGCVILKRCLTQHYKSKKHINLMEKLNQ